VDFNLNGLPDNAVYKSGFRGDDGSIVELNAMSLVDTVFSYMTQGHSATQFPIHSLLTTIPPTLLPKLENSLCLGPFTNQATIVPPLT
jgi:hypothetical protein